MSPIFLTARRTGMIAAGAMDRGEAIGEAVSEQILGLSRLC
jgi:hypothetical protein